MNILSYQRLFSETSVKFTVVWGHRIVTTILISRQSDRLNIYEHALAHVCCDDGSVLTSEEEEELLAFLVQAR